MVRLAYRRITSEKSKLVTSVTSKKRKVRTTYLLNESILSHFLELSD